MLAHLALVSIVNVDNDNMQISPRLMSLFMRECKGLQKVLYEYRS